MSKKKFESPKVEIIRLDATDILTSSTDPFDGEWVPIGGKKISAVDSSLYNLN
ncbi:MAG: hypothetical protein IKB38_06520 [Clostridia bacterium]|nr:hypothetical protein [Clostridia bacterium]